MAQEFSHKLDAMLQRQFGIDFTKKALLPGVYHHDIGSATPGGNKQPRAPLGMLAGVKAGDMPNAEGRAAGTLGSPVVSGIGGDDIKLAMIAVKKLARNKCLAKLGYSQEDQRFLAFGPSDRANTARLVGMGLAALQSKYASCANKFEMQDKLASDQVAQFVVDLINGKDFTKCALSYTSVNTARIAEALQAMGRNPVLAAGALGTAAVAPSSIDTILHKLVDVPKSKYYSGIDASRVPSFVSLA
jgi:hypothetical protein